ncbi:DUF1345 domain-containing protein [Mesorhizobium sp. UC22_110]|uniref:DUF1345 domain-containing protein n=1 Tax=unclassified Mesorhizobium TaxID=325217 RepID=UPI00366B221F
MSTTQRSLFLLVAGAFAVGGLLAWWINWKLAVIVAANCFFAVYLIQALRNLDRLSGDHLKKVVARSEAPEWVLFLITMGIVATSLVSLFMIINAEIRPSSPWLILALLSVPLGWATTHAMAASRYAHLYWRRDSDGRSGQGLEFAGETNPDALDFAYFAFVIGMAAQTSDVTISSRPIRRFALVHSIFAYFFNAVLVAAAVNVVVSAN